jgi:hypothetical protein
LSSSKDSKGDSEDSDADAGMNTNENELDGEDSEAAGSDEPNTTEKLMTAQAHTLQRSR